MAKATITLEFVPDMPGDPECFLYFNVEYKPTGTTGWTALTDNPISKTFEITGLTANITYDLRYRHICCDGSIAAWTNTTFDTTI